MQDRELMSHQCLYSVFTRTILVMSAVLVAGMYAFADVIDISSAEDLQRIGNDPAYPLNGDYRLTQNIDATATAGWNDGAGFDPIGHYTDDHSHQDFSGTFDGQGHTINGLVINRPGEDCVGLFGFIAASRVTIRNVELGSGAISGNHRVGGICGYFTGHMENCRANLSVTGVEDVGGLVGVYNKDTSIPTATFLTDNSFTGDVRGKTNVGGIVGTDNLHSLVQGCFSDALVDGEQSVGGIAGLVYESAHLTDSYSLGDVTGKYDVGGLAGYVTGTLARNYAEGNVSGLGRVGGLVGYLSDISSISYSYATGTVIADEASAGGLVGYVHGSWHKGDPIYVYRGGELSACYALGSVSSPLDAGGLTGYNAGYLENCFAHGPVSGNVNSGGLTGTLTVTPTVINCYSAGLVTGSSNIGGLIGLNLGGQVTHSFWDTVTSGQSTSAGGLGRDTPMMQQAVFYTSAGWDLTSVWNIDEGVSYPFLRTQTLPEGEAEPEHYVTIFGSSVVEEGAVVVLKAVATVPGNVTTYAWYKNGVLIPECTEPEYVIGAASAEDAGAYSVTIINSYSSYYQSADFTLRVFQEGSLPMSGSGTTCAALVMLGSLMIFGTTIKKRA